MTRHTTPDEQCRPNDGMHGNLTGSGSPEKNWLIFSYFANIDGKASSQHLDDRLPCLRSLGKNPVLLSSVCGERRSDVPHFRVPSIAPSGIRFELRYLKRRSRALKFALLPALLTVLPFYFLEKIFMNLESEWSWFLLAFLRGMHLCKKFRPETLYSTGGPASAHLAAGLLSLFRKIPWIAELQDPLVFQDWPRSRMALKINAALERFILRRASAVVFLCEGARERAIQRTGSDPAKARVIYPGALPVHEPQAPYVKGEFCRFGHFGSLGGSRDVETFLDALRIVFSNNPDLAGTVRFDLYGTMDRRSRNLLANFEYPDVIGDHGKISRRDALRAMRKIDVLLLIQNRDNLSYETIPSKVYEYFQMMRPMLGLVFRNPHLKRMLEDRGHSAAEADSAADIAGKVLELLQRWNGGDFISHGAASSPYTVQDATEKILALLEDVIRGTPGSFNPSDENSNGKIFQEKPARRLTPFN
jgi:glycosyltransferase involved in cell wall biosynthesis